MSTEQATPMPTDAELFNQSMAPEPAPTPAPATPAPEQPPQQATETPSDKEPVRDERGRFTGEYRPQSLPEHPELTQPQQAAVAPPAQGDDDKPPPHRWKEMREERDALQTRVREMEFAFYDMQQKQRAADERARAQQPQPKPQAPDPITDPEGFYAHVNNMVESRARTLEQNTSFRMAHQAYGDTFEHAYGEMINRAERGDPSVARHVMSSPDPGMAMMAWYRQARNQARLGEHDPETWAEKVWLEERLKDQKFQGALLERMRGSAQQAQAQPNGGGPVVNIPPSLNRMAAAAPVSAVNGDMSDTSLFDHAFRQGRQPR